MNEQRAKQRLGPEVWTYEIPGRNGRSALSHCTQPSKAALLGAGRPHPDARPVRVRLERS
jgi:hypothetical protein